MITEIREKITERFEDMLGDEHNSAFKLFASSEWAVGEDTEIMAERDKNLLDFLYGRFKEPLDRRDFHINLAKKEWEKVIYCK